MSLATLDDTSEPTVTRITAKSSRLAEHREAQSFVNHIATKAWIKAIA